jgi:hypothetical protein
VRVRFRQDLLPEKGRFAVKRKRFSVEQIVAVLKQAAEDEWGLRPPRAGRIPQIQQPIA